MCKQNELTEDGEVSLHPAAGTMAFHYLTSLPAVGKNGIAYGLVTSLAIWMWATH